MRHNIAWTVLVAVLLLVPLASAQDNETKPPDDAARPDDAAWVEDCPPDMMCAMDMPVDNSTHEYGPEDCIHCSHAPVPDGSEEPWAESCPDGAECLAGSPEDDAPAALDAPVVATIGVLALLGGAAFAMKRRRS